jgi:RHS repeat-associated protein
LNNPLNITGYSQVLKQTETNLETGEQANITYIIGRNRISQITLKDNTEQELYFTLDGHGSTRALTDFVGAIVELYSFDAYGNAIGFDPSVALTEFLYSGEQFDSKIGQQYLRQRYYNPVTGRFNRLDPFFGNLNDPQSLHKYLYTHTDPINGIDPTGTSALFYIFQLVTTLQVTASDPLWLRNATLKLSQVNKANIQFADKAVKSYDKNKIKTALIASRMVYDLDNTREGFTLVEKWGKPGSEIAKTGLKAALYNTDQGYVLAFAGTENATDWLTNIQHIIGLSSSQHKLIKQIIDEANAEIGQGNKISIITGHSLGGSLATLATIKDSGKDASKLVIFNPEYLHENNFKDLSNKDTYFDNANIWQVKGDPVAVLQFIPSIFAELPFVQGLYRFPRINVISLKAPNIESMPGFQEAIGRLDPVNRHQLDAIEKYLREHP